ncbi:NAD(P)/FAD-dependent oxidoreductase [Brevibacillus sp. GCM10020057]|uniref:NAD(P)/FAD-dependent oxidoreductase n=1 Tax=Brevibacillus sp. GCM10020057 TaxID=3317327 RepID=UPI003640B981
MRYDTIIVGGGIGGLQTAIQLARNKRRVAVLDVRGGRSTVAKAYRNVLGFQGGVSGETLRRIGREQAVRYGAMLLQEEVVRLETNGDGSFYVYTKLRTDPLQSRTLVMATGICDPFPDIPGIGECLGISIFLCPDCDGYETVAQNTAVIGALPQALEMADELSFYTSGICIVNHARSEVEPAVKHELARKGYRLADEKVTRLLHVDGALQSLELSSGRRLDVTRAFLAFPGARPQTDLLRSFSIRFNEKGHVQTNPRTKETDHPNVWAVGDIAEHSQQVAIAMGDGAQAAIWIQKRLRDQDKQLAERR